MNLISLSIKRPIFILMITLFMIVLGVVSLRRLAVDLYPNVSYPVLAVRANLPGASPEEMEQLVTKRLEDTLSTLPGLESLRSISRSEQSTVILEFSMDTDIRFQEVQVRAKVSNLRKSLPDDLTEPVVTRQDPDDTPIIEIAVTGRRDMSELSDMAEKTIALRISQLPGVGSVDYPGQVKPEVRVALRKEALNAFRMNPSAVVDAMRAANRNDPVGTIEGKDRTWFVRSLAEAKTLQDVAAMPIGTTPDGEPLHLRDVASITDSFAKLTRSTRLSTREGGEPALILQVLKQSGENTVAISDRVRAALPEIEAGLPDDVRLRVVRDNADLIRDNVADVYETIVIGAILTVIVVLIFLRSPRSTVTTGLSLPSSVITTFAVMAAAGFTINVMTLLSLSLAIGLLVDDAIVVRENIFRHMTLFNRGPKESAIEGTKEVALAVVATTLSIVAVFLPVGFMGGVSGLFFKQFALTVVFAIMVSLWDALTMAPMLSAYFANVPSPSLEWAKLGAFGRAMDKGLLKAEHAFERCEKGYERVLAHLLRRPAVAVAATVLALAAAVGGFMAVSKTFLPAQLGDVFTVQLNGPLAVPLATVSQSAGEVEKRMRGIDGLAFWTTSAGVGWGGNASISMNVRVAPEAAKSQDDLAQIRDKVRKALNGVVGYNARIAEPADPLAGSSGRFQPVAVAVSGPEIGQLRAIAGDIRRIMLETKGITDVPPLNDEGLPEVRFRTDAAKLGFYGMSPKLINDTLRIWVEGDTSNVLRRGDDQIPIRVTMDGAEGATPDILAQEPLYVTKGQKTLAVPIGQVVDISAGAGPNVISREQRERVLRVGGNLEKGAALGNVVEDLQGQLAAYPLPKGYSAKIVGQNEQMDELFGNIVGAILLGSLFVYMVLASLFESFVHPLTVMMAIPLAASGAVGALLLFGLPLDLYAGIGMILLAGIVAKNSILLVDFALQKGEEGMAPREAMLAAAPLRLRPIVMTSIALVAGMIPVASGLGASGAARMGLGIATIGGVVSSTLLTLVIVPNMFVGIEALRRRVLARRSADVVEVGTNP